MHAEHSTSNVESQATPAPSIESNLQSESVRQHAEAPHSASEQRKSPGRLFAGIRKCIFFFWKYFVGVVLCQTLVGSVLIVGWTYRMMQRVVLKQWWKQSRWRTEGRSFEEFVAASHQSAGHLVWPNWIVGQKAWSEIRKRGCDGWRSQFRVVVKVAARSLGSNLKLGVQGIFNTWMLTLPGCIFWLFAWYDGWNNSFNKGYEQASVGPLIGVLGVVLFIAAMFYVPMAQARQASTGRWRSFYQFRLIWNLIRSRWLACLGLAVLYSLLSVPVTILKTAPAFFPQIPNLTPIENPRALEILRAYFFWSGLVVLPAFVILRLAAARIYASALLAGTRRASIAEELFGEVEWEALHQLDLLEVKPQPPRHLFIRLVSWAGSRVGKATVAVVLILVWFTFVAQIFVSEFFHYHPGLGWMNQPLVQLPVFKYIPPHLKP